VLVHATQNGCQSTFNTHAMSDTSQQSVHSDIQFEYTQFDSLNELIQFPKNRIIWFYQHTHDIHNILYCHWSFQVLVSFIPLSRYHVISLFYHRASAVEQLSV